SPKGKAGPPANLSGPLTARERRGARRPERPSASRSRGGHCWDGETTMTLRDLEAHFADRHLGPDRAEQAAMLETLGLGSLDELADRAVPASIRDRDPLDLP